MKAYRKFIVLFCLVMMLLSSVFSVPFSVNAENLEDVPTVKESVATAKYDDYSLCNSNFAFGSDIALRNEDIVEKSNAMVTDDGVVISGSGYAKWKFNIEINSKYHILVNYTSADDVNGNIEMGLKIDDNIPFKEANSLTFYRIFKQKSGDFEKNASGNDILPEVAEIKEPQSVLLSDSGGYEINPFVFNFETGEHTISLIGSRSNIKINYIALVGEESVPLYKDYIKSNLKDNAKDTIEIQAEKFNTKNSITILPSTDRTSPDTYPQSAYQIKLNTLGGSSWKTIGDKVSWNFEVKTDGWYTVSLRFRQNIQNGIFSSRKLYIDGKVPFEEAKKLRFNYSSSWNINSLSYNGEELKFYFSKGKHEISLEAVAGDLSEIISEVDTSINELNKVYRKIVQITGPSADVYRDYKFDELIPDSISDMDKIAKSLNKQIKYIDDQEGATGSYTSLLRKLTYQLETMSKDPKTIAKNLDQFKSNLSSLGTWLLNASEQPLEVDSIYIKPSTNNNIIKKTSFFRKVKFAFECFISSFVNDYNSIGSTDGKDGSNKITIWIQKGRDQGEVFRELIDSSFSQENNCAVDLKIVPTGTLLKSVLSGKSPDVVFDNTESIPVDYALRGAVADFYEFDDCREFLKSFSNAAVTPAQLDGKLYGIPQEFTYNMFFYRTDIFEEYGFSVPKTWNELRELIPSLQRNNMSIAIPHDINMYATLVYQNKGKLYRENGKYTNIDSSVSVNSFIDFCEFFTLYNCPVTFDFANRFRSGEVPCGIQSYSIYNQLVAFAPEIKGMWNMTYLPGTPDENGNINNTSVGVATYIMLMKNSKNKELSWNFIKWFMSEDVQVNYASRMESILGNCAKVPSANIGALSKMAWTSKESKALLSQLKQIDSVPQCPGGYYLSRVLTFAFNRTYNSSSTETMGEDPADVLGEYVTDMNNELERKRQEFGLE